MADNTAAKREKGKKRKRESGAEKDPCVCRDYHKLKDGPNFPDVLFDVLEPLTMACHERIAEMAKEAQEEGIPASVTSRMSMAYRLVKCTCQLFPEQVLPLCRELVKDLFKGDSKWIRAGQWYIEMRMVRMGANIIQKNKISCNDYELMTSDATHPTKKKKKKEKKKEENICCVCRDKKPICVLVPCGHLCLCEACAQQTVGDACPLCRVVPERFMRVYTA